MCTNRSPGVTSTRYTRVAVARIPPIVPDAGVDDSRLAHMKNAGLPVTLHGQLALEHGEPLNQSGMAVLPYDACPDKRGQLGGGAALRVVPWTFQDRGAFPADGVLPDLPN
jgi:hypothetical protein